MKKKFKFYKKDLNKKDGFNFKRPATKVFKGLVDLGYRSASSKTVAGFGVNFPK